MDITGRWEKALKKTEIIRSRIQPLNTFKTTQLSYIFLAESAVNIGDTQVRKGSVLVEKPSIIMPDNSPHFDGFEFDKDFRLTDDTVTNFLLVRGVRFPSYKYNNRTASLDLFEGSLSKAITHYKNRLQKKEDVYTGLLAGSEDCWQFSVIIFICTMVARAADIDIRRLLEEFGKDKEG